MIQLSNSLKIVAFQLLICQFAFSDSVVLTPLDINQGDTNTAQFSDGSLTLTPFIGTTPATFNALDIRLGIDGNSTNDNAFNDPDTDVGNDNDERLQFDFSNDAGLSQISWDFSRADGLGGGVSITGFASNPGATFVGNSNDYAATVTFDSGSGTLNFEISAGGFSDFDGILVLANPQASSGQTLLLRVGDVDQENAQLAITGITYECDTTEFAETTVLQAREINGEDTNTSAFDDGNIILTPFIGDVADTFNGLFRSLGIDGNGTGENSFNEPDQDPDNDNDERLQIELDSSFGLAQLGWDFSRADGESGGVTISGFSSDPQAFFTGITDGFSASFDSGNLTFEIPGETFGADDGFVNFANPGASVGQTLLVRVADIDQAGAQLAVTSLSYIEAESAVLLGDINFDGSVNLLDVSPFIDLITTGGFQAEADINEDGFVDLLDVAGFVQLLTGG